MASRNPQTQAKRARELALKDKRELKRAKKAQRAADAAAAEAAPDAVDDPLQTDEEAVGDDE